jgi:hypothetical protein
MRLFDPWRDPPDWTDLIGGADWAAFLKNRTWPVHALFGAFLAGLVMPKDGKLEVILRERLDL